MTDPTCQSPRSEFPRYTLSSCAHAERVSRRADTSFIHTTHGTRAAPPRGVSAALGTAGSHLGSAFAIERWQYERANAIETREGQWDFERRRPSDSACMGDGLMYNVVIRGARSSHSVDVENDSVRIAAVVAMPDDMCGDVPCGFVELRKGCHAAEAEVIDHGK